MEIANAVTINFEICRTSLLPGLFKTVQSSGKHMALPLKLFEVSDIITLDPTAEVDGTRTGSKVRLLVSGREGGAVYTAKMQSCDFSQAGGSRQLPPHFGRSKSRTTSFVNTRLLVLLLLPLLLLLLLLLPLLPLPLRHRTREWRQRLWWTPPTASS